MPPQLRTLIPLFVLLVAIFLVARYFLVPESFGEAGHYRFDSLDDNRAKPMHYAGKDACAECHEDYLLEQSNMQAGLSCETCHGPGLAHYDNPDTARLLLPIEREHCGLCHSYNPSRSSGVITMIDLNEHNPEDNCIDCHNPHTPWETE